MSAGEVRVGDVGTRLEVTLYDGDSVADISSATVKQFILRKPTAAQVVKDAEFTTDGSDGRLYYIVQEGDLDTHGMWQMQVAVVLPGGKWKSDIISFEVHRNI